MRVPHYFTLFRIVFTSLLFFTLSNNLHAQAWNYVGESGFSASTSAYTSFAFNGSTPYVAYRDNGNGGKATVKQFDGANWVTVGTAGFSAGTVTFISLACYGGTPYVAYSDATNNKLFVKQFNGANWVAVGNIAGISANAATYISLVFNGSTPYVAYRDNGNGGKATVMQFDGANWVLVGSAGFTPNGATYISLAFNAGSPYISFQDFSTGKASVMKFDGSSWVAVGSIGFSTGTATYISLAFNGGAPYVAYQDATNSKLCIMQYNGANWVPVGNSTGISLGAANYTSLVFNGSTPYVAYRDAGLTGKATLMKFDGANWVPVGNNGISAGATTYTSLAFNGSTPYIAYTDAAIGSKVSVVKFDAPPPATGLNFDGVNDYVSLPASTPVPTGNGNYTIEAWIKPNAMGNYGIIGWGTWGTNNTVNALRLTSTGLVNYWWANDLIINTSNLAGAWHHVAATFDGTTRKIYLDGVVVGSDNPASGHAVPDASNLAIGVTNNTEYFSGNIDEVRVWNRALCQSEIRSNMNCGLNATGQTGLAALYGFNQGNAGDNNSTVTTLTDASGNGNNGALNNFALTGLASNWLAGKATGTCSIYTPSAMAATSGGLQVCQSATVQAPGTIYQDASCNLIAKVSPSGATPVSGTVNTCVNIDGSVQTYNGQPYVQRHYDIEPAIGASTATATITLTFTQAEFDAFNAASGSSPALPTGAADAAGIANLRITQYHGVGTAPGNYPGSTVVTDPVDANIVWNATLSRWEVTFDVTGFSGFYVTADATALPIKLSAFTGSRINGANLLKWTTSEESNTDHFEVERNTGSGFAKIGAVKASKNTSTDTRYTFEDAHPADGVNQYRLKSVDIDGRYEYSKVLTLKSDGTTNISLYPNPTQNKLYVDGAANGATYQIKNISGQVLIAGRLANTNSINVNTLTTGIYVLTVDGQPFKFFKK